MSHSADIDRRRVIQGAAATAALGVLPKAVGAAAPGKLTDIDHLIILTKENRSFDHYFGSLAGVRGFDDPTALRLTADRSVFHQPDRTHKDGYVLPFRLDTTRTSAQKMRDLGHQWNVQHASWNNGKMDAWIAAHRATNKDRAPMTMGYFTCADIPFYYALADAFTVCDGYHASVMGPTHPNRYFLMTGTIDPDGRSGRPATDNDGKSYAWETYPERLERAGVSWRIYYDARGNGYNMCRNFVQYQAAPPQSALFENGIKQRPFDTLLADLRSGNIPQVTWILPPKVASEHPDDLPAAGEDHTHQVLTALWSNPALWARSAVILNYDENDGLFDHVTPPTPARGTPGEFVNGAPIGLGFRVPCLVISPFSRGGYVSSRIFDHTSVLRLIETRFGVEVPALSRWRRDMCGDLAAAFGFGETPDLAVPDLPETTRALAAAQRNAATLPPPVVPARQSMPQQETGARKKRA